MIGKIVLFNNYYNKIVIATENEDPQMVYFILGRITFKLMDFEPIEISPLDEDRSQIGQIIKMIEVLARL